MCARFKYNTELWRQYLRFCLQIDSKKNFYRALSNALRFNGQDLSLWEICVYYELEMRKNPFKARKLYMKALRVNNKNLSFWVSYLRFECKFIKMVEKRQELIEEAVTKEQNEDEESQGLEGDLLDGGFVGFEQDDNNRTHLS